MTWKRIFRPSFRLLLTGSLIIFQMLLVSPPKGSAVGAEGFFLAIFNTVGPWEQTSILSVLLTAVSCLLFFFATGDSFLEDMKISYVYLFPRIGSKRKWLGQQTLFLLLRTVFFWMAIFLLAFCFAMVKGLKSQSTGLFYVEECLCAVLPLFFLSFLQNLLSLRFGASRAFLLTACFFIGSLWVGMAAYDAAPLNGWLFALLPPAGQMLHWHGDAAIPAPIRQELFPYPAVPGFDLWKSFTVLLIYWAVSYGYLYYKIERSDLMDFVKEEN